MSGRVQGLEQQRMDLVARSDAQRQLIVAQATAARESVERLRLFLLIARTAARLQRIWNWFGR